ncbi:MAG: acetolactate synthase small subunit [Anaerolineae bacterium]|nr:acetolactate synthase small subunit [Anaerolineae bacterium]
MKAILSALVENKPGVLNRVVSLFRRRNFNMDSLTVGRTHRSDVSRMTIVMDCDHPGDVKKIEMNLYKLVDVIEVQNLTDQLYVQRDMALVKITCDTAEKRNLLTEITYQYGARIVDIGPVVVIVEITGQPDRVEAVIAALSQMGIVEVARTGLVAMGRGTRIMQQVNYESKRAIGVKVNGNVQPREGV